MLEGARNVYTRYVAPLRPVSGLPALHFPLWAGVVMQMNWGSDAWTGT